MLFRFWRWRIEVKLRNLDDDKKIVFLTQELLKAVAKSGRDMETTTGLLSLYINVFQKSKNKGYVENVSAGWKLPLGEIANVKWKTDQKESLPATENSAEG